ncbi:MAG: NADH-ubiquinone oxidoreductase-F iron-sulfur binding region domain-containing protein [Candidatus Nanopelagicales bacterium]
MTLVDLPGPTGTAEPVTPVTPVPNERPGSTQVLALGPARLLAGVDHSRRRLGLEEHRAVHGALPVPRRRGRSEPDPLLQQVTDSGLRGRGGAAFPFGIKLAAVASRRRRPVVVVNASEGEPLSAKDASLLTLTPHLVLDGAVACARAVGARDVVVVVHRGDLATRDAVDAALYELERDDGHDLRVRLEEVPDRYVSGEASAVIRFLSGGPALPTGPTPRPDQRGVDGRPTLLSNAETYAHVGLIARHGAEWFRQVGVPGDPGTRMVTVRHPSGGSSVLEVPSGLPAGDALEAAGIDRTQVGAVLMGGFAGTWLDGADAWTTPLQAPGRGESGVSPGVGLLAPVPVGTCTLAETARITRWMAGESAQQCGPCLNGLPALAHGLQLLASGQGGLATLDRLHRWCGMVEGRGACHHPGGVARTVRSALTMAADDAYAHAAGEPCPGSVGRPVIPVPGPALGSDTEWR